MALLSLPVRVSRIVISPVVSRILDLISVIRVPRDVIPDWLVLNVVRQVFVFVLSLEDRLDVPVTLLTVGA